MIFKDGYNESRVDVVATSQGYKVTIEYCIMDWGTGNCLGGVEKDRSIMEFKKQNYSSESTLRKVVVNYIQRSAWGPSGYPLVRSEVLSKLGWSE